MFLNIIKYFHSADALHNSNQMRLSNDQMRFTILQKIKIAQTTIAQLLLDKSNFGF